MKQFELIQTVEGSSRDKGDLVSVRSNGERERERKTERLESVGAKVESSFLVPQKTHLER